MLALKGQILQFISHRKETRTKDITTEFGNTGQVWTSLNQLEADGLVKKPKRGYWKSLNKIIA